MRDYGPKAFTGLVELVRQHTSAYDSIRQHTSAYVSMRGPKGWTKGSLSLCALSHGLPRTAKWYCLGLHSSSHATTRHQTSAYVNIRD
jgi:hypothetical protein